jgi:hypothetical protein
VPITLMALRLAWAAILLGWPADNAKDRAAKERVHFDKARTRETSYATCKQNGAEGKFCWK